MNRRRNRRRALVAYVLFGLAGASGVLAIVIAGATGVVNTGLGGLVAVFVIVGGVVWANSGGPRDDNDGSSS